MQIIIVSSEQSTVEQGRTVDKRALYVPPTAEHKLGDVRNVLPEHFEKVRFTPPKQRQINSLGYERDLSDIYPWRIFDILLDVLVQGDVRDAGYHVELSDAEEYDGEHMSK